MRTFSKSKILAYRQCPKRLWLEVHQPELREDSAATLASFQIGFQVGDVAHRIYDDGKGALIDVQVEGFNRAFAHSAELLETPQPIFEAGFSAGGALAFADVMLPVDNEGKLSWRMVEVKSSTSVKDYHRDDAAVQAFVARSAGVPLVSIALAHIDSSWVYPGNENYWGLLKENDLTAEAFSRADEVQGWISSAQKVVNEMTEPAIAIGDHCNSPYECGFYAYCSKDEPKAEFPISWLPRFSAGKIKELAGQGINDLRNTPDDLLNSKQQLVKDCTLSYKIFFDAEGAAADLARYPLPAYFLDFESIQFAVPIWKGTRPYQQITFQFSLHIIKATGELEHIEFLDVSGNDPSEFFAKALIEACGDNGPVFVYSAGFETARIRELAERYPQFSNQLLAINARVVDLLPIARERYYHPDQQGSWSIKNVLPAVVPELRYDSLDGVQNGGMAMGAFLESIHPHTTTERKAQIKRQLLEYCKLDTYAMVRLWQVFSGRNDLRL